MTLEVNASNILTHYYKIAHLGSINYTIFTSVTDNHQQLLELELQIRHENPKILITYYNKCLHYFTFGHNKTTGDIDPVELVRQYPNIQLKYSNSITMDQLQNPHKPPATNTGSSEEYIPFENLSFLKAAKKMVLYTLSLNGIVKLFGNYCVTSQDEKTYTILYIDPILFPNGDLMISCVQRAQTKLFNYPSTDVLDEISEYVIYIVPSGIRCHLYDPSEFKNNIVEAGDVENSKLLQLLTLSTGVDFTKDEETITWVKLIPNLKHLNNQTSPISKFIHSVENKKFILWPWKLCLLQLGKFQELPEAPEPTTSSFKNPINLISDYLDFNISNNLKELQLQEEKLQKEQQKQPLTNAAYPSSVPSSNGDVGSAVNIEAVKDIGSIDMSMTTPMGEDLFNLPPSDAFFTKTENGDTVKEEEKSQEEEKPTDDMELDDLFGEDVSSDDDNNNNIQSETIEPETNNKHSSEEDKLDELLDVEVNDMIDKQEQERKPEELEPAYLDIPKDQMITKLTSPDYNDPGAPLPLIPTPFMQSTAPLSSTNPPSTGPNIESGYYPEEVPGNTNTSTVTQSAPSSQMPPQKSIFSPILFNPIIKSNIDTKYGKGGKFYVDRESSIDPDFEKHKRSIRATSVSGFHFNSGKEELKKRRPSLDKVQDSVSSSEESDEDEDMSDDMAISPPLKLNTEDEGSQYFPPVTNTMSGNGTNIRANSVSELHSTNVVLDKPGFNPSGLNTGGFGSPFASSIAKFSTFKAESPLSNHELQPTMSPMDFETAQLQQTPRLLPQTNPIENASKEAITESASPSKILGESSNYLPLILRSINVSTIPNLYLMNNLTTNKFLPNFSINDDDDMENDLEITKSNEMIIKLENLQEFLSFLSPNLVYDLGFSGFQSKLDYYLTRERKHQKPADFIKYQLPPDHFTGRFTSIFPYSYKVNLIEFLRDYRELESEIPLDNQLSFLDDITNDDDFADPRSQYKRLKSLEWDSLTLNDINKTTFDSFKELSYQMQDNVNVSEESYFKLPVVKTRIMKNDNIVNLNSVGLEYWKYLNFSPVQEPKNFQILLFSETFGTRDPTCANEFLDLLSNNYTECNFGNISRVNLSTVETRSDLESISNGVLLVNKDPSMGYNDFYIQANKKLISLVELIKLDLINKTNNFEFDRPLLLLFVNFNDSLNSMLQICKIFRNFKVALAHHQLPLVQIFTKIIPGNLIVKRMHEQTYLKVFSNTKLTKISMNLYNQCPNNLVHSDTSPNTIYTSIVKEPPTKIQFKFMSSGFKDNNFNDDIFLHVAYERSIDKNWFSAAWSDPHGTVTHTKSWYCSSSSQNGNSHYRGQASDIISITDDIWNVSTDFFKHLNDVMNNKVTTSGGKKFLVLTRINSVIPDDELVQWKRLSVKNKEISLIVLSVSQSPKLLFSSDVFGAKDVNGNEPMPFALNSHISQDQTPGSSSEKESIFRQFSASANSSPTTSSGALVTSPSGLSFHSPQQFLNAANFLSPQDHTSGMATSSAMAGGVGPDTVLHEPESDIIGIVPKVPLPSFNSPTRLGMKIGYLIKDWNDLKSSENPQYMVFEVNLLSCSNYWDLDVLMKLILNQYKKLIVLNDILGMRLINGKMMTSQKDNPQVINYKLNGMVPWHIAAVGKSLDYLVHVYVEE
ncbi:uncharacterized protein SPAPADRAFT_55383 [Spathaspora passalidarum NRRL Y-27907]|uniref:Mediator of RNA polymerase II transcription subunit 13 n=1 Tax=Spathaspora passalidarum (strain NRRL Y-27907 / 11-Y1) TaxID=619300 RepID=G3AMS3_SPAPN|nr:uncharacterized protein SPAPADRAFT_55383 [Spathaspora passalidarum NRRL Y-27907]EGW33517.1 hypothetical protein SPAPADRAFT_55383 [Spathaspora passalidarum NRRL Y-27907]